ncbi:hypothetical protein MMC34_007540 [Xylographa carneopallida]|nr:hypothetical protein [Xylographa carneopallida]
MHFDTSDEGRYTKASELVALALRDHANAATASRHVLRFFSSRLSARALLPRTLNPRFYSSNAVFPIISPSTPPPRSLLRRAVSLTALGLLLASSAFLLSASPALPSLLALAAPPSPASTLTLYTPPDPVSASINHHLTTHPLALSLRQNRAFTESRPHVRIPAAMRAHNLTGGTLLGAGRIAVPPLAFIEEGGKSLVCLFYLGSELDGKDAGYVHGGLLATILDEGMARCCFPALPNQVGMTASLTLDFRTQCPSGGYVVLRAWTRSVEGRKAWVEGRVESLLEEGEEPVVFVQAEALFIEPRQAAVCVGFRFLRSRFAVLAFWWAWGMGLTVRQTLARLYPAATA